MESAKIALIKEKDERRDVEKVAREIEKKALMAKTRTKEAASRALVEFRAFRKFEDEVAKGLIVAYQIGF